MLQPGTKIGRYEIQRKLARGGMGTVYVAHDPVLGRMVAVKVFIGDLDVPDAAERFAREARAAASLNHTNIVTVFDFGEVASQPYIVMEYIQGETITEIIRRRTTVPLADKLRWLEDLCAGAASAHKMDVVHRDIKPSNLMIDRTGRVKILDFGIAKIVNSLSKSVTAVIGTPGYMAPEQLLGQPVDARTDIFAIGVVSFELLTYEEAFQGDSFTAVTHRIINEDVRRVSDLVPDAPPDLCAIVDKCLQKERADRYQDAESIRIALSRVRRRVEHTSDFDDSSAQTIVTQLRPTVAPTRPTVPVHRIGPDNTSGKPDPIRVRTAELTPPPDPVTEREALARAQRAKIQGALQRSEACLQSGEFERALAASQEVLEIEPAHGEAIALQLRITAAVARQKAASLLADARVELGRGALTRCKSLLDEARHLDPGTHDADLERELRLARVEEERKRHRTETINRTTAEARAALERGRRRSRAGPCARGIEPRPECHGGARHRVDGAARARRRGRESPNHVGVPRGRSRGRDDDRRAPATDVAATARPRARPGDDGRRAPVAHAAANIDPCPALADGPATAASGAEAGAASDAGRTACARTASTGTDAGSSRTVRGSVRSRDHGHSTHARRAGLPCAAPPPVSARPATPGPSSPRPVATPAAMRQGLPVQAWIGAAGSAVSQLSARARAIPRTQLLALAGVVGLVLLVVAVVALRRPGTPAAPQAGLVVIEALPWANVTAIKGADGANRLTAPAVTPLSMNLPAGKYTVELASPSSPVGHADDHD